MSTFSPSSWDGMYTAGSAVWATEKARTAGILRGGSGFANTYIHTGTYYIDRTFFVFDTSSIPDGNTIVSATISLTGANDKTGSGTRHYAFYDSTGANTVEANDFDNVGTTIQSDSIAMATFTPTGTFTWNLNAAGLASISKTGLTKFCLMELDCDVANVAPTNEIYWTFGTPVLTVTHVSPSGFFALL